MAKSTKRLIPLFKNHFNSDQFPRRTEKVSQLPSETVPDQTMSVQEIMRRHVKGLPIPGQKVATYDEDYMPDLRHMDLADIQALKEENEEYIKNQEESYKEFRKKQQDKAAAARAKKQEQDDSETPMKTLAASGQVQKTPGRAAGGTQGGEADPKH